MSHKQNIINNDVESRLQELFQMADVQQKELQRQTEFSTKTRAELDNLKFKYNESEKQLRTYKSETMTKIENINDDLNEQLVQTNTFAGELAT